MCTINCILSLMHGCTNSCNETSSTSSSTDHWLNAVHHCQFHSCTLHFISSTLTCISLNHVSLFSTDYLFSSIHFSPILQENLYHFFAPFACWYVQRSGAILRNPTCSANANKQKWMIRKQMLDNIHFLSSYFTFKKKCKHIFTWLHQTITYLHACSRKHALSIGKTDSPTDVPDVPIACHVWQKQCSEQNSWVGMEFKCGPNSNSPIKLGIKPSEIIKNHSYMLAIPETRHLHEKVHYPQTTSLGNWHTHMATRKACQTMCTINHILAPMHGCPNSCDKTSSMLSVDHWLKVVCHLPMPFLHSAFHF